MQRSEYEARRSTTDFDEMAEDRLQYVRLAGLVRGGRFRQCAWREDGGGQEFKLEAVRMLEARIAPRGDQEFDFGSRPV